MITRVRAAAGAALAAGPGPGRRLRHWQCLGRGGPHWQASKPPPLLAAALAPAGRSSESGAEPQRLRLHWQWARTSESEERDHRIALRLVAVAAFKSRLTVRVTQ